MTKAQMIEKVNEKYNCTVICVTHNDAVKDMAHRVIKLKDGQIRKVIENDVRIKAADLDW